MKALYITAVIALCLLLGACGNKGDLYLPPLELTEEQKTLLDGLDDVNEAEKAKKKKSDSSDTPISDQ